MLAYLVQIPQTVNLPTQRLGASLRGMSLWGKSFVVIKSETVDFHSIMKLIESNGCLKDTLKNETLQ